VRAAHWREELAVAGHAVVRGVALDADDAALRSLATALCPAPRGAAARPAEGIARVEAMDVPRRDPTGRAILSTTADDFPLHTDDTFAAQPARFVLMHCWQADAAGGGTSLLAHVRDLLPRLDAAAIGLLREPLFASPFGLAPVLWDDPGDGQPCIRFNHRDFASFGERYGPRLTPAQAPVLDTVLAAARTCTTPIHLAPGDCLVVDNHRVLHGRTAFHQASGRLLKRLRVG
jgi:alpha-ketoglutarate-dependent taurine dioxygenase